MKLNVKDRLTLLGMLPQEGSLSEMVDIYDLARELKLSDEEKTQIAYKEDGRSITWDIQLDPQKDITFSSDQMKIVLGHIDILDKQRKIDLNQIETILKIKNG